MEAVFISCHDFGNASQSFYLVLVAYEIADRLVDLFVAKRYKDGEITDNPEENVFIALMVLFSLGLLMTVVRVYYYLQKWKLSSNDDDSKDEFHHAINMSMSLAKIGSKLSPRQQLRSFRLM